LARAAKLGPGFQLGNTVRADGGRVGMGCLTDATGPGYISLSRWTAFETPIDPAEY
jgi:hypothetical protein